MRRRIERLVVVVVDDTDECVDGSLLFVAAGWSWLRLCLGSIRLAIRGSGRLGLILDRCSGSMGF